MNKKRQSPVFIPSLLVGAGAALGAKMTKTGHPAKAFLIGMFTADIIINWSTFWKPLITGESISDAVKHIKEHKNEN